MFGDENDESDEGLLELITTSIECDTVGQAAGQVVTNFIHQIEETGIIDEIELGEMIGELKIGNYKITISKDSEDNTKGLQ